MAETNGVALELPTKYRPKLFRHVVGQPEAVRTLQGLCDAKRVPHTIGFFGPKGTGKTTLARIVARKLGVDPEDRNADFQEINAAESRGIDTVREIKSRMGAYARAGKGKARVWVIDEAHRLTGEAQDALLKVVEEPPDHVYFFFASTRPEKMIGTLRDRCLKINLKPVQEAELSALAAGVCDKEGFKASAKVIAKIVQCSDGSPRLVLKHLNTIVAAGIKAEADQLEAIQPEGVEKAAIDVCRAIIGRKPWKDVAAILKACKEDAEAVRRAILGYARSVLLGSDAGQAARAAAIIGGFRFDYYACGDAGLAEDCFNALSKG